MQVVIKCYFCVEERRVLVRRDDDHEGGTRMNAAEGDEEEQEDRKISLHEKSWRRWFVLPVKPKPPRISSSSAACARLHDARYAISRVVKYEPN